MGLLNMIPGMKENPFGSWVNQNRNWLGQIGAGLASGKDFGQGLANAAQMGPAGQQLDKSEAERQAELAQVEDQKNKTLELLQAKAPDLAAMFNAGAPMGTVWGEYVNRMSPKAPADPSSTVAGREQLADQYGLQGEERTRFILTNALPGGNQSVRAGVGQPIFGKNKQTGAVEPWQSMTDGTMINTANPQANPADYDFSPAIAAGERAGAVVDERTAANARAALPATEQSYGITTKVLTTLKSNTAGIDEIFGNVLGVPNQKTATWPGSPKANALNQIAQLGGQGFLQMRQQLKGAGAVTDYEGQRAEDALSRMQLAVDNGSKSDFEAALVEYEDAMNNGLRLLREVANGGYKEGAPNVTSTAAPQMQGLQGQTSNGLPWSVSP